MKFHDDEQQQPHLPGSRTCVGCEGQTFRNRQDGLCPRCAWGAESLIEQVELDGLDRDLRLLTAFEAYCHQRDMVADGTFVRGQAFASNLPPVPTLTARGNDVGSRGAGAASATGGASAAGGSTRPMFVNPGPAASANVFAPTSSSPTMPAIPDLARPATASSPVRSIGGSAPRVGLPPLPDVPSLRRPA